MMAIHASLPPFDYGPKPEYYASTCSQKARLIEHADWIFYGQVNVKNENLGHGKGILVHRLKKFINECWWINDLSGKRGRWINEEGQTLYEGEYGESNRRGKGYLKSLNGDEYTGDFNV